MPFKPIDFTNITPQGNPFLRDFISNLATGYQTAQLPAQLERERQKEELANKMQTELLKEQPQKFGEESQARQLENSLNKFKLEHEPQKFSSEMSTAAIARALDQAHINQLNEEAKLPFGGKGVTGEIGQAIMLNVVKSKFGENSQIYKDAKERYDVDVAHQRATTDRQINLINSASFRLLPALEKSRVLSNAVAMGYTGDEAAKLLTSGKTLQDLANAKGVNLADVQPNYPLTTPVITGMQNRTAFVKEIQNLESKIVEPLAKTFPRYAGYSLPQIAAAISNKDPDEQGKILAARALQPELAAFRYKAAAPNGQVGIEAINELQNKALGQLKVIEAIVSPEAYRAMQGYISEWISGSINVFNESLRQQSAVGGSPSKNNSSGTGETKKAYNVITKKWEDR